LAITLGSNISSLTAQRGLEQSSSRLSSISERLASGQRINKAADDAAGLAIALELNTSTRIFSQGLRNINDGVSMLNIVQGTLGGLSEIAQRQAELAEQAANGSFSLSQRKSMQQESDRLTEEFNRIVSTTSFNGIKLLSSVDSQGVRFQFGSGLDNSLLYLQGSGINGAAGDGTFTGTSTQAMANQRGFNAIDYNRDGRADLLSIYGQIFLSNGDGSFSSGVTIFSNGAPGPSGASLIDVNGDAKLDWVNNHTTNIRVALNNGNDTFASAVTYAQGFTVTSVSTGDINGDGIADLVASGGNAISVLSGNGNGTFKAAVSYATSFNGVALAVGDFNGDGKDDIQLSDNSSNQIGVFLANSNGTLRAMSTYFVNSVSGASVAQDFDRDGNLDIVVIGPGAGTVNFLRGNGDGTFRANTTINFSGIGQVGNMTSQDINNDGFADYLITGFSGAGIILGNGDGTFKISQTWAYSAGVVSDVNVIADFTGDGVKDAMVGSITGGRLDLSYGNGSQTNFLAKNYILTQQGARQSLDNSRALIESISQTLGRVGATMSRAATVINVVQSTSVNFKEAHTRIMDSDVSSEVAEATRLKISQQVATSVLAQANQSPALALRLLS
jgi:flagellin